MNSNIPRAVTFFAGPRDHYELPLALEERGWLERFVTEAYWPLEHPLLGPLASRVVPGRWLRLRHREGLSSRRVVVGLRALAGSTAARLTSDPILWRFIDRSLGRIGRRIAAGTGAAVFTYSYYAHAAFEPGPDRPDHRFLFQMHPHPISARRILTEELQRYPWARASLLREEELGASGLRFEELCAEPSLANGWVAASGFTADTLAENGISREAIQVIPYGVEAAQFPERSAPPPRGQRLRLLFVGSAIQRKGLCDLFEAIRRVGPGHVELTLAGRGYVDSELLEHYADTAPRILRNLSDTELNQLMHQSDLFVLPSLVEGFGHVIAEAMSSGLPVLASTNTCAADLIDDGVQGFIVPIRAPELIAERLTRALDQREQLEAMGRAAAARARSLSWALFRERIADAYQAMLERRGRGA